MGLPAIRFDTLSIAKELEESGVPKEQAEAQVKATVKVINMVIEEKLVTKDDLLSTEKSLKEYVRATEKRLEIQINKLDKRLSDQINGLDKRFISLEAKVDKFKSDMIIQLGGLMIIGMGALALLIKL